MNDTSMIDLLGSELGDAATKRSARVVADVLGPGSTVQAVRIANALRDAGVLSTRRPLPEPDTTEDYGDGAAVPYWFTPTGTVSVVEPDGVVGIDIEGAEFTLDIASAEDNARALLAVVQHLRNNPTK